MDNLILNAYKNAYKLNIQKGEYSAFPWKVWWPEVELNYRHTDFQSDLSYYY